MSTMRPNKLFTTCAAFGLIALLGAAPAIAGEDDEVSFDQKIMRNIMEGLGLKRDGEAGINYQERAPLVIPPSRDLPPPESADAVIAKNPAWPKDPDVERRKLEAAMEKNRNVSDERERLNILSSSDFVARRATVLEREPPAKIDNCSSAVVAVITYTPVLVRLQASSPGNCLLVASDAFDPGWKAYSDGTEVPIYLANHLFRAIYLRAGPHQVEMRYESQSFKLGIFISMSAGLIFICGYIVFQRRIDRYLCDL